MSLTGLPQSAVILFATMGFASVAWQAGIPREPAPKCDDVRVVQYFAIPEPAPLIQTPPLGWPVTERQRAYDAPPAVEKASAKEDDADEPPRRHHYRHRRRHWR